MIVCHEKCDPEFFKQVQKALYELKDPEVLRSIKPNATGFGPRRDKDYDNLRVIMKNVSDNHTPFM